MKKFVFSFMMIMTAFVVLGQKKLLTAEDAAYRNRAIFPLRTYYTWVADNDKYMELNYQDITIVDLKTNQKSTVLSFEKYNSLRKEAGLEPARYLADISWIDENTAYLFSPEKEGTKLCVINVKDQTLDVRATLPENAENIEFCDKSMRVAYTIDNNLFVTDGKTTTQLTDNAKDVLSGQAVHRNEFAIEGGIFWSPDGSRLAYYTMDQSMVEDYPLVDITTREAQATPIKYPMAGMTSHVVTLHVYDFATQNDYVMNTGEPADQYLTAITWNNDNKRIYIALLNRAQNHLKFNEYEALGGKYLRTIFEDQDEQYVEPQGPAYFLPNNNDRFIWKAQRDGFYHLYLYDLRSGKSKQLTKGNYVVTEFNGFDAKGENFYYTSTEVSPLQRHFYKQNIKSGKRRQITRAHGTHSVQPSASGRYFIDSYSSTDVVFSAELVDINAKGPKVLHRADDPLKDYALGKTILDTIEAEDGQALYTRMILPPHFSENEKYPVIVYVYGGPHAQMITDSWLAGGGLDLNFLAAQGFIVFTLDNRGSTARGEAFEQVIHRNCGQAEMRDQIRGIEYLRRFPFVDMNRIGSDGWSYGGFMSTSLKLNYPEIFKVSVAGGPVLDWKYYEIMYGERYMDTPEENPEGYELTSLENKADRLEGKLLIIHCTTDPVVVWQHSLVFVQNCIEAGKQLDYFVYPGHEHNVRGKDRIHLMTKIANYFKENL